MSLFIKKESAWSFITSSSGGVGVEFVNAEGGKIWLQDPEGRTVSYYYGGAGMGVSAGIKLPKIGKIQLKVRGKGIGAIAAPASFPNTGKLYVLESCENQELVRSDIQGVCMFVEAAGGIVGGGFGTAMIFGMNPVWLAAAIALGPCGTIAGEKLLRSATGILLMAGLTTGIQAGGGIGAFLGGLY
ncbi:MAG TPA: hypothetical protein VNO55_28190 [Polyangia bacterium]|nr:hypothetical protein [Polyangia bacterium]